MLVKMYGNGNSRALLAGTQVVQSGRQLLAYHRTEQTLNRSVQWLCSLVRTQVNYTHHTHTHTHPARGCSAALFVIAKPWKLPFSSE